ncbi:MAG: metalloregulator ArsR/SmtB family transcription factor [Firmicutes bacterium]|nr:metalloregulator ArsR/SmtB family transcription factor [Bacillota bacterium]
MLAEETREGLLASFWQALSHPLRIKVLEYLRNDGALNVGELVQRLQIGQGHLSNHLACLKNCGLVVAEVRGRFVYYRIRDPRVVQLLDLGSAILQDHLDGVASCRIVHPSARPLGKTEVASSAEGFSARQS